MRALLGLIGGARPVRGWLYRELSVGYVAQAAGCGWETARRAWHRLREVLGWWSVVPQLARDLGAQVRELEPGRLYGQHLLLAEPAVAAARQVVAPAAPVHGDGWLPLQVVSRPGGRLVARCPWHDDRRPSALLHVNADGRSGPGTCLACAGADGAPLRFFWRLEAGSYRARLAKRSARDTYGPSCGLGTGTIYSKPPPAAPAPLPTRPLQRVLGTLHGQGMTLRASRAGAVGLIDTLRAADRAAQREGVAEHLQAQTMRWHYSQQDDYRRFVPDLYVSMEAAQTARWQEFRLRDGRVVRRPCGWSPGVVEHVLVDLDGFAGSPVGDRELEAAGRRLARWAADRPELSGEVAVVRTSPGGVQVVFGLRQAQANPRRWWSTPQARELAHLLDEQALREVRAAGFQGGHADRCVHAAGRMMRRPGPRVTKDGLPYVARLVMATG